MKIRPRESIRLLLMPLKELKGKRDIHSVILEQCISTPLTDDNKTTDTPVCFSTKKDQVTLQAVYSGMPAIGVHFRVSCTHREREVPWGQNPNLDRKSTCVLYILHGKVVIYNNFSALVF